jgi:hypothetical protein
VLDAYRRAKRIPTAATVAGLEKVTDLAGFHEALDRLLAVCHADDAPVSEEDAPQLAALEQLAEHGSAPTTPVADGATEDPPVETK